MKTIERKYGSFKPLMFKVDLTDVGKTPADVDNIFLVIKKSARDADADAIMLKSLTDDNITINSDSIVTVPWGTDEYSNFTIGKKYVLGLFLKFSGDPVADEDVGQDFSIVINQRLLHDH